MMDLMDDCYAFSAQFCLMALVTYYGTMEEVSTPPCTVGNGFDRVLVLVLDWVDRTV